MAGAITDLLDRVSDSTTGSPVIGSLAAPGKAIAAASIALVDATNWTTTTAIHFSIYLVTSAGVKDPSTQTDWKGTLSGTTISNLVRTGGVADRNYTAGAIVEITPTARYAKDLYDWATAHANQDGSLKAAAVQAALGLGASTLNGWNALGYTPNSVTYLGNRAYSLVFSGVDISGTLATGMRIRTTRTVAAPNQCANLNGTTQYFSKSSPNGMSFTDDFAVAAWIKISAYPATTATIASRSNGTNGWSFRIEANGTVSLCGFNTGLGNTRNVNSYASLPLNKWVHVCAQLDMSGFPTASPTTNYVMIDGQDILAATNSAGTNPTTLIQAGNYEIGSINGGTNLFTGKIAQVAVFNAKVTQATMRGYMAQGYLGSETSEISAHSLSNSVTDLNTTNNNGLTANGSATTTTSDSPFGGQADGSISTTLDYATVGTVSFSTNTTVVVVVPEGCTIPTSGGVSAVAYSANAAPYGFRGAYASAAANSRAVTNSSNINLSNANVDLNTTGLLLMAYSPIPFTLSVTVSLGVSSTTDYEFRPAVRVDGSQIIAFTPAAALGSAGGRANVRSYTWIASMSAGVHTISAGVELTSSTSAVMATQGGSLSVVANGDLVVV